MIYPVCNDFSRAGKYLLLFPNFPALETGVKTGHIMTHQGIPALETGVKTGYIIAHLGFSPALLKNSQKPCKIEMFDTTIHKLQNREIYQNCL